MTVQRGSPGLRTSDEYFCTFSRYRVYGLLGHCFSGHRVPVLRVHPTERPAAAVE
jgi:hypothetical protein